jgi:hypothetical protein
MIWCGVGLFFSIVSKILMNIESSTCWHAYESYARLLSPGTLQRRGGPGTLQFFLPPIMQFDGLQGGIRRGTHYAVWRFKGRHLARSAGCSLNGLATSRNRAMQFKLRHFKVHHFAGKKIGFVLYPLKIYNSVRKYKRKIHKTWTERWVCHFRELCLMRAVSL